MGKTYKKVAIIGAHGVGKTWLVDAVHSAPRLTIDGGPPILKITEQARTWINQFNVQWETMPLAEFMEFERALYYSSKFAFNYRGNFIADRSPLDPLAYLLSRCPLNYKVVQSLLEDYGSICHLIQNTTRVYWYKATVDEATQSQLEIECLMKVLLNNYYRDWKDWILTFERKDVDEAKKDIVEYFCAA